MTETRRRHARAYQQAFAAVPEIQPLTDASAADHAWHLYVIRLDPDRLNISRDDFIERLRDLNVGTSVHFIPLHLHPYYREKYGYRPEDFPGAIKLYECAVSLPLYSRMSSQDVEYVSSTIARIIAQSRR
jgi:perosamine synthetase